jgi:hypothetical protein
MAPAIAISCQMDYQYLSEIFIRNLGTELASITNNNTPTLILIIIIIMPMEVACLKDIPSWETGRMGSSKLMM